MQAVDYVEQGIQDGQKVNIMLFSTNSARMGAN